MHPDQPVSSRQRIIGLSWVVGCGIIWGTIPVFLRFADGASVVKVFYRVLFAALVVGTWMALSGGWRELRGLSQGKWMQLILQGLILTLNWWLFLTSLDMTTVATAELLGYTAPVLVAVLAPWVTKEPFDRRIVIPLALALTGILVILAPQGLTLQSRTELVGAALAFGSALTYATLMLRSKNILRGISSGSLMLVEYSLATLVLLPFVIGSYAKGDGPTAPGAYAALVMLGVVHTAGTGFLFLAAMRRVRTDHVAVLTYVEPVSAVLFAALLLGEPLTVPTVAGGLMVVAGGLLVMRLQRGEAEPVPLEAAGTDFE